MRVLLVAVVGLSAGGLTCPTVTRAQAVDETEYFSLHSDPWINLHHFLYQWARADLGIGEGSEQVLVPERDHGEPPEPEWEAAVAFYRTRFAALGHFDEQLLRVKAALLELGGDPTAVPYTPVDGHAEILSAAMGVYLRRWWPEHDRANRRLIASLAPDLRATEERWVEVASRLFGGTWSDERLRVDMSAYANRQGGYTSNRPTHTVIASRDEMTLQGLYGLESVLHESGHMSSLAGPLRTRIREILQSMNLTVSPNLRHMVLFATAGWFVADVAAGRGDEHVPYVVATGISDLPGWAAFWAPIQDHWYSAYREEEDPDDALVSLLEAVGRLPD